MQGGEKISAKKVATLEINQERCIAEALASVQTGK